MTVSTLPSATTTDTSCGLVITMDSNFYTEIIDEKYEKGIKEIKDKDLHAKFEEDCEKTPYLQQCKMYDD